MAKLKLRKGHYQFAHAIALGEDQYKAWLKYISPSKKASNITAQVNSSKLMTRPEMQDLIKRARDEQDKAILKAQADSLAEEFKGILLTTDQLDLFHCSVIRGQIEVEEVVPVVTITRDKGGKELSRTTNFMRVKRRPNIREKQVSLDALYRRRGDYAPSKLFGAFGKVNDDGDLDNVERFVLLSSGERVPLP